MDTAVLFLLSVRDAVAERLAHLTARVATALPRKHNRVGVASGDLGMDGDGRVWVEVGGAGLRLRVVHLHPANPAVADTIQTKLASPDHQDNLISLPTDDDISLASLEDYWFNHWQGPYILQDSNQNAVSFRRSRRSLRKSKRKFRCSVCQKKIVGSEGHHGEAAEACHEAENPLAHVPSIKLDSRGAKPEDVLVGSSDDEAVKPAVSEEALSRYSASDEQLARAFRVMDHELRTSFSLFNEEAVTQDVVDGVSMDVHDATGSPDSSLHLVPPLYSPRQSRSCPCSPKLSGRNHSPKSNTDSPKPRSRSGSSKFSLSSSLLAIHRQASNSLRPDFLKFDLGRGDQFGSGSKNSSQHNSLKNELRHSRSTADAQASNNDSQLSGHSASLKEGDAYKSILQESVSLPTLKLSKMSMVYKGGVIVNQDKDSASPSCDRRPLVEGACALPSTPEAEVTKEDFDSPSMLLPDVVPRYGHPSPATSPTPSPAPSPAPRAAHVAGTEEADMSGPLTPHEPSVRYHFDPKEGVVNLGFDGHEESSDFSDLSEVCAKSPEVDTEGRCRRGSGDTSLHLAKNKLPLNMSNIHGISAGHAKHGQDAALALEVSPKPGLENAVCSDTSDTVACSNGVNPGRIVGSGDGPVSAGRAPDAGDDDVDSEPLPIDHMLAARQTVFWWQRPHHTQDSEFCQNYADCKVKQKPVLVFLHGMGGSSDSWRQQLWYFVSCGYEVVAPDLLGHGLSSAPDDPKQYSFAQMLDHMTLVFDLFVPQGRKCVVIGHGYGCSLAAALARGRPHAVRLVVLAGSGGPSPLVPRPPNKSALYSTLATCLNPFLACGCCREVLYAPRGKHFGAASLSGSGLSATPRYVLHHLAGGQHWPEGDVAFHRRITVPTLLLHGMRDDRVTLVEMCEMERTIPRAFLEMIPSAGHDLMTDAPLDVCHALHRFIKRWKRHI